MSAETALDLEDIVTATYCALDDALRKAGVVARRGKLVPRPGPAPDVDDREVLCLAVLQEVLGFESDNRYHDWLAFNRTMRELFPRQLSRPNFADRRAILTPLMQRLCASLCDIAGESSPPFTSSTRTPPRYAGLSGPAGRNASAALRKPATVLP